MKNVKYSVVVARMVAQIAIGSGYPNEAPRFSIAQSACKADEIEANINVWFILYSGRCENVKGD